jgi:hypothetical protein
MPCNLNKNKILRDKLLILPNSKIDLILCGLTSGTREKSFKFFAGSMSLQKDFYRSKL